MEEILQYIVSITELRRSGEFPEIVNDNTELGQKKVEFSFKTKC